MDMLFLGASGPNVELLQLGLNRAGFDAGKIDGIFGSSTEKALKDFQGNFNLKVDGIAGSKTWNALFPFINGYVSYVVRSGDSLYSIAKRFNSSVNNILIANSNQDLSVLYPGQSIVVPFGNIVATDVSYSSEILNINLSALRVVFPFLQVGFIGKSVLGESIPFVRIGRGKKEVFYSASIHGNEWITSVVLMKFVEDYCSAIRSNGTIYGFDAKTLFDRVSIYIVPMVNLDGVNLVTGAFKAGSIAYNRAKRIANNFPDIPFVSGWKANINGVDLKNYQPFCKVL